MSDHRSYETFDFRSVESSIGYTFLSETVVPRPIAFVSTENLLGQRNLAPFSFFMLGGSQPASLAFSTVLNSLGSEKDTLHNIRETGEFVVNGVHREMAAGMNRTSATVSPEISEWELAPFTPLDSHLVAPPRIAESLWQLECRVYTIVDHGLEPGSARYIIGEVLVAHRQIGAEIDATVARLGGRRYVDLASLEIFEMERP